MSAAPAIKTTVALTVSALIVACGTTSRQVTTTTVLDRGSVECHSRRLIWESSDIAHGCDVTVTYRGTEECPARLLYVMPAAVTGTDVAPPSTPPVVRTPGQHTDPAGAAGVTVKLRDAQAIWLACGNPREETSSPGCSYTIDRINCSRGADELDTTTNSAVSLTNVVVRCGGPAETVWEAPVVGGASQACHVTLRLRGTTHCSAQLEYVETGGRVRHYAADAQGEFVSLINVKKISLTCGDSGSEQCTCEVVQIDCPQ